jgi:hypothetical protein
MPLRSSNFDVSNPQLSCLELRLVGGDPFFDQAVIVGAWNI